MGASLESRLMQLEQEIAQLRHELAAGNQQQAVPQALRDGKYLAVLNDPLAFNGTAEAETVYFDGTEWKRSGTTLTVQDFFLNSDDAPVEPCTAIKIEWFDEHAAWIPTSIYCRPGDWLEGCEDGGQQQEEE